MLGADASNCIGEVKFISSCGGLLQLSSGRGPVAQATRAHLAARSEHFRALFYGGMREASGANEQIVLLDIAHPVFLLLLEYIYTDQVGDISWDRAVHLLIAPERFLLDRLKALCEDIVRKYISVENVVQIMMT